jgi:hypothetical protein
VTGAAILLLLTVSCRDTVYVAFSFSGKDLNMSGSFSGVEVLINLSSESPLKNRLEVRNNSDEAVSVSTGDVLFRIKGRRFTVPVEKKYDIFINEITNGAILLCNESGQPYRCVDAVTKRSDMHKGKGFEFGTVEPGEFKKGYIVFDFPMPFNNSTVERNFLRELKKGNQVLKSDIVVELNAANRDTTLVFPVSVRLYDEIKDIPYELAKYWE